MYAPCHTSVQHSGLHDITQVNLCDIYFIWVHELQKGFPDELWRLFSHVGVENWVKVEELEGGGKKAPVYRKKNVSAVFGIQKDIKTHSISFRQEVVTGQRWRSWSQAVSQHD
jgi:hypothetical protein